MDDQGHRSDEEVDLIGPALLWLQDAVAVATLRTRQAVLRGSVLACAAGLQLWTAGFLYATFYYSYMPLAAYDTPVHYHYRTDCGSSVSLCSFPVANISLLRNAKHQVMTYGHPYRISLELEMPESPANQELGMFMVQMNCYSRGGKTVTSSGRSAMLRYRSGLLRSLGTLVFLPVFLTGLSEQSQLVEVELYSDYVQNAYSPSIGVVIEIQSDRVQIYSSHLYIHSRYTGIRYFLFNFPLMSAFVGVATNFGFLGVLLFYGYMQMVWAQISPPQQARHRSLLQQVSNGLQSLMNLSVIEYPEDDDQEMASSSSDQRAHLEALNIETSY